MMVMVMKPFSSLSETLFVPGVFPFWTLIFLCPIYSHFFDLKYIIMPTKTAIIISQTER